MLWACRNAACELGTLGSVGYFSNDSGTCPTCRNEDAQLVDALPALALEDSAEVRSFRAEIDQILAAGEGYRLLEGD